MVAQEIPFPDLLAAIIDNRGRTCPVVESGVPLIATNCVKNDQLYPVFEKVRYVDNETYATWFRGHPEPGDIVFVCKGSPGRVAMCPDPVGFCIAQDMVAIRADDSKIYPKYLFAVLRSGLMQNRINNMHVGTLIPHFKKGDFKNLRVPVVEPALQQAIGDIYFDISSKIDLNQRLNETLEAQARMVFVEMFERRQLGPDVGVERVPSEFGSIPVSWRVESLGDVLDTIETGGRPRGGVAGIEEGIPSVGAQSIVGLGKFDYSQTKLVPVEYFDSMKRGRVADRDVLLYKDGGKPGTFIPHVAMFGDGFPFASFAINEHVYRLRTNGELTQEYLYFWLSSPEMLREMASRGTGVAIPGLNSTNVKTMPTLVPSSASVAVFNEIAAPIVSRILAACSESKTLADLRDTLLPKLLSGEIRVGQAEKLAEAAT